MAYYVGTTREVRVGDKVIGVGTMDSKNLTGRDGEILEICSIEPRHHAILVRFKDRNEWGGSFRWYCNYENVRPAFDIPNDGKLHCVACGAEITRNMKMSARLYRDTPMCDCCVAKEIGKLHDYHYGKSGIAYAYAKDKITLGVEIELDDPDDEGSSRDVIRDVIDYARDNKIPLLMTHEHDGSLSGNGFESVTAPLTIAEWNSATIRGQLDAFFESAKDNGFNFYSDDHAGLHVHIGRKDLCGMDKAKSDAVGLLMGWAVTRLWDSGFEALSRRECLEYCDTFGEGERGLYDTSAYGDRYYAVNIGNSKTIELRIFKGARCLDDVLVAVDVCYMLAKWATKKINAFGKRASYSAKAGKYDDALVYADRVTWSALVKYSKFPEVTLPAMRSAGIDV